MTPPRPRRPQPKRLENRVTVVAEALSLQRENEGRPAVPASRPSLRRCLVTGDVLPREKLMRFAIGPGDEIVPDVENDLPGRGLWLTARREIVEVAAAKGLFARAARRPVSVPSDLADRVDRLLSRRCLNFLGLARRSGAVAAGYDAVTDWLRQGKAAILFTASDSAEGGGSKVLRLGRAAVPGLQVIALFVATELGEALGRDRNVHVAVTPGRMTPRLVAACKRLAGYRGVALDDGVGNISV